MLKFNRLSSGGIITNYDCSSKCRHCVYASSPSWPKDYMTAGMADEIFRTLKNLHCNAVHIGGGEPLLHIEKLLPILDTARKHNIYVEYIETNASWYKDQEQAASVLRSLQQYNVGTLLISIDPFHNEFIPFYKVKGLMEACRIIGMEVFPWRMEFWEDLDVLDDTQPHRLEEYEEVFGADYKLQLANRYGLNFRGRALQTYKDHMKLVPLQQILQNSGPCRELSGTQHFHIDLYGNFIPQSCAGLSINFKDLTTGAIASKYPLLHVLDSMGIKGLYELAVNNYGFTSKENYTGKCELCYAIRRWISMDLKLELADLQPRGHYLYM